LNDIILERKVALRARHKFDNVFFCRSSTHVGNSLVLFYPNGNRLEMPIPGSIEYIVAKPNNDVVYVVRQQLPALPGTLNPFRFYPHFPAKIYSPDLSNQRQVIHPDWVISHYARWNLDKNRAWTRTELGQEQSLDKNRAGGWAFDGRVLYVKCFAKLKKYTLYIIPRIDLDI
jgi:hypothetical protein